jgi:cyclopropane fatty-acyl-phospholipid synthase-like methyltransferase
VLVNHIDLDRLRVRPGDRVLDLGCARGEQTIQLAHAGLSMVGADVRPEMLDELRAQAAADGVTVQAWTLDVAKGLPEPGTFDAVVCTEVLEHVPDYRTAMAEIVRALKPGGRACIAVPTARSELVFHRLSQTYVQDTTHVNVFTRSLLLTELERAGLRVECTEGKNFEWAALWLMHAPAGTRADHTGRTTDNQHLNRRYWRIRHMLTRLRLEGPVLRIGNRVFPKSRYVYAVRAG